MIVLRVYGEPQSQGNKTGFVNKRTGRVVMTEGRRPESRAAFKDWRGAIAQEARDWQRDHGGVEPLDAPVSVRVAFWLTKPVSLPKWRWLPHGRPDIDKLARSVLDALTGVVIRDDGRVVDLRVNKTYAMGVAPGCQIIVERVEERDLARTFFTAVQAAQPQEATA